MCPGCPCLFRNATTEKMKQITEKGERVALAVGVSPSPKKRSRV
ncbi:hypothetical protein ACHAXT_012778 [Thalassiosira profunda]